MARRLKIAFVVDSARTKRAGGLVAAERIIDALRRHHDVTSVGVGGDVELEPMQVPLAQGLIDANSFAFAKPDDDQLGRAFDGADLVHVQLPFFLGFRALSMAESLGIPVVAAHHVQPENVCRNLALVLPRLMKRVGRPSVLRGLTRVATQTFFNRAAAIICPSQLALDELKAAGLTAPASIISNGAPAQFTPLPSRPPAPFTVLTVGRLVPEKRQDLLLEAVGRSRHASAIRVVIAGRGPLREKLETMAKALPARVELGFQSDEDLLHLYQTADLYVHASEVELEGMAVLEAMRCGCPSVLSDSPTSAAKQFALSPSHLFPNGDASALAAKIDEWFENPRRLELTREKTLGAVRNYGLDHTIEAYEELYQRVVAQRREVAAPGRVVQWNVDAVTR